MAAIVLGSCAVTHPNLRSVSPITAVLRLLLRPSRSVLGLAVVCAVGGQCLGGGPVLAAGPKPLVFLADDNYPPLSYLENGVAKGVDVEVAQALATFLKRDIRVELMDWRAAQERVLRGDADGLLSMSMTKERAASYDFSEGMITHTFGIFVKEGYQTIRDAGDLAGRSVGVTRGGLPKQILESRPGVRIVLVRDYLDGFAQLSAGRIDALAGDNQVAAYTIERHHLHDIVRAGPPFATMAGGIAVRKGNSALVEEINAAVRTIATNGTLADIQARWRPSEMVFVSRQRMNRLLLLSGGAVLVLLSAAMAAWVVSLKKQIRAQRNQRGAEEALRLAESKYRLVVENANDIIFTVDLEGYCLAMNRAGRQISGQAPDEPRGVSLQDLVVPEQAGEAWRKLHAVLAGESVPTFELDIVTKRGNRLTLELDVRAIQVEDCTTGIQGIARDVTKRKELEAQLRQAQKMEAIGRLAGGIAHDFNNLLTVILGYTSFVARQLGADSPMREDLEEIHRAARSAESLTSQLLIFSRKSIVNPTVLDFNEVVRRLHKMLNRVVGKDIDFIVRTRGDGAFVLADGGQMEQIVMNLVVNARDAMPNGGRLSVETDVVSIDERLVRLHPGCAAGSWVKLTVTDTGSGMTKDTLERIFTPFFTTKGPTKGTGLGLATVHGIVQQAGGYISVESEPGRGAMFAVYLPQAEPVVDSVAAMDAIDSYAAAGTILLVEDDESIRTLGARTLRQLGYSVVAARHAAEALTLAERHGGKIDLLFTDLVMPGLNGQGLAERLKQAHSDLKVLYTSGFVGDDMRVQVEAAGDFLQKPYTPDSLARTVREILEPGLATPGAPRSTPHELVSQ